MPGKVLGRLPVGRSRLGRRSAGKVVGRLPRPEPAPCPGREPASGKLGRVLGTPGRVLGKLGLVLGKVEGRCTDGFSTGRVLGIAGRELGMDGRVLGVEGRVLGRLNEEPVVGFRDPVLGRLKLERLLLLPRDMLLPLRDPPPPPRLPLRAKASGAVRTHPNRRVMNTFQCFMMVWR